MPTFMFSTYYFGSSAGGGAPGVTTFVSDNALGRPDVLAFAARYEGTAGCRKHMNAAACGEIAVMSAGTGHVVRRWPRAEALAADALGWAFFALGRWGA